MKKLVMIAWSWSMMRTKKLLVAQAQSHYGLIWISPWSYLRMLSVKWSIPFHTSQKYCCCMMHQMTTESYQLYTIPGKVKFLIVKADQPWTSRNHSLEFFFRLYIIRVFSPNPQLNWKRYNPFWILELIKIN